MNTAAQLHAILSELPSEAEAGKRSKQELRDFASELGLTITGCRTKQDLVEAVSVPSHALRYLHAVQFEWRVECERTSDAFVRWRGSHLLVRVEEGAITVKPGDPDLLEELLVASLQRYRGDIIDVSSEGIQVDRFLQLLDTYLPDPDRELYDQHHGLLQSWQLDDGTVAWLTEGSWDEGTTLLSSHWDFIGPGVPSVMSDNPGTVTGTRHRGYLLCVNPAAEVRHVAQLPTGDLNADSLLAALGAFYEQLVWFTTYSLDIDADLDADEIRRFLEPAQRVGGLWVNGRWWYESPTGWSDAALEPLAPPTLDPDDISAIHLAWLYPAYEGTVDIYLFEEVDPSLRMALTTLAAHKANGWEREDVAWVEVERVGGTALAGVATRDTEQISALAGVPACLQIDLDSGQSFLRASDGALIDLDLFPNGGNTPPSDALDETIAWLRTRSGPYPPDWRAQTHARVGDDDNSPVSTTSPTSLAVRRMHVADLEPGDRGHVFISAVGIDRDRRLWIDPGARVMKSGLPAIDPRIWIDEGGVPVVDTEDLEVPLPYAERRHSMPTGGHDS